MAVSHRGSLIIGDRQTGRQSDRRTIPQRAQTGLTEEKQARHIQREDWGARCSHENQRRETEGEREKKNSRRHNNRPCPFWIAYTAPPVSRTDYQLIFRCLGKKSQAYLNSRQGEKSEAIYDEGINNWNMRLSDCASLLVRRVVLRQCPGWETQPSSPNVTSKASPLLLLLLFLLLLIATVKARGEPFLPSR